MFLRIVLAFTLALTAAHAEGLSFQIREGLNLNAFVREGQVSAHVVLRDGHDPRILVAFPAGNSGVGLWFKHLSADARWSFVRQPSPTNFNDEKGRLLHGVNFTIKVDVPALAVKQTVLSNVRVLRDYQSAGIITEPVMTKAAMSEHTLLWRRDRLDGAAGYYLRVAVTEGAIRNGRIQAGPHGLTLSITAASGDPPLQPLDGPALLGAKASPDAKARQALSFLSYRQKFLAGSWRFNTYFGRDTLLSLRLLLPALQPDAVEDGLRSVLSRLSADGEVAHEEDISEFAILDHMRTDGSKSDAPVYDYKMVDETLLLASVAAAWLIDDARSKAGAASFLSAPDRRSAGPINSFGLDLVRNLRRVVQEAAAFAQDPRASNLVGIKPGQKVGNWRDSNDGLGGGRYPYDVNAVLMPAALQAVAKLSDCGLLSPYLAAGDRASLSRAGAMARTWQSKAPPLFEVAVDPKNAADLVSAYAREAGVSAAAAVRSLPQDVLKFHALSLGADGKPVPVLNSDESFALVFSDPDPAKLEAIVTSMMRPFPAGLMTGAGLLVVNPAFAPPPMHRIFERNAYHGTVVWSWQQAMVAAGLKRQLSRGDLPPAVRTSLKAAQSSLWRVIESNRAFANSELWSWTYENGHYRAVPFGASASDADESDAVQLWSTVYLAIPRPGD